MCNFLYPNGRFCSRTSGSEVLCGTCHFRYPAGSLCRMFCLRNGLCVYHRYKQVGRVIGYES